MDDGFLSFTDDARRVDSDGTLHGPCEAYARALLTWNGMARTESPQGPMLDGHGLITQEPLSLKASDMTRRDDVTLDGWIASLTPDHFERVIEWLTRPHCSRALASIRAVPERQ